MIKKLLISFAGIAIICAVILWGGLRYLESQANAKAVAIYEKLNNEIGIATKDDSEKVILLAQTVFQNFEERVSNKHILLRLRPYLTSQYLPNFLRLKEGAVEMNVQHGECDNAARMLSYLLAMNGIESRQWDMLTNKSAHTALAVSLSNGREVFVDPFFGVYSTFEGRLLSMPESQEAVLSGRHVESLFKPLGDLAKPDFYKQISSMQMAGGDEPLTIHAVLPAMEGGAYVLGQLNGSADDLIQAGAKVNITPYWHYIGSRYNRRWVRVLEAQEATRLTFTIIGDIDEGVLTSMPKPQIEGRHLIWNLQAGETVTFIDGNAERSWLRMNSFQGIDQISVAPLN